MTSMRHHFARLLMRCARLLLKGVRPLERILRHLLPARAHSELHPVSLDTNLSEERPER